MKRRCLLWLKHWQQERISVSTRSSALETGRIKVVRVVRDDGVEDALTRRRFEHYNEAYDELERFYADVCCSDERVEYSIVTGEITA